MLGNGNGSTQKAKFFRLNGLLFNAQQFVAIQDHKPKDDENNKTFFNVFVNSPSFLNKDRTGNTTYVTKLMRYKLCSVQFVEEDSLQAFIDIFDVELTASMNKDIVVNLNKIIDVVLDKAMMENIIAQYG